MAGPGDSLLIRAGLIRPDQLAEAQKLRARSGGTTGEWLIRLGVITEEQLVEFYHRRLMVPRLQAPQLARVPSQVLLAVPAEMAVEFLVFPVAIDDKGALTLAMADPADTHVAEEVAFFSGRPCHRAVAAPSALREAIEKSYRTRGMQHLVSPRNVGSVPAGDLPLGPRERKPNTAPMGLGLEEVVTPADDGPGDADEGAPVPLTRAKPDTAPYPLTPTAPEPRSRPITQSGMPIVGRSATSPATEQPIPLTQKAGEEPPRRKTLPGVAVIPETPVEALREAQNREQVADILLGYGEQLAPLCALLVMRRGALAGYDARGGTVHPERFRSLLIPLDEPSLFRDVVQTQLPFRGPLPDAPAHRAIVGTLGRLPGEVLLLPISVSGKAVAVLYAAGFAAPLPEPALKEVAVEAGRAYERLIRARKG